MSHIAVAATLQLQAQLGEWCTLSALHRSARERSRTRVSPHTMLEELCRFTGGRAEIQRDGSIVGCPAPTLSMSNTHGYAVRLPADTKQTR
jgi:hypothetical protein